MVDPKKLSIVEIDDAHIVKDFDCGKPRLNAFIRKHAKGNHRRFISRTYVAVEANRVYGFYSLASTSVTAQQLPPDHTEGLPRYPLPAALLGQLAVDRLLQRQGLGRILLVHCLENIVASAKIVAAHVVLVDAKDDSAKRFYIDNGFIQLPDQELKLFLPMATVCAVLGVKGEEQIAQRPRHN